ncbi:MAG TPA: hypothetical protein P5262_03835 [Candidatus Moranbacteria bacterium]|nr:hypothetical protein [Candidatus Moranbacteria bacterium]
MESSKLLSKINKNNLIISYKLLNDLLFIEIIFFLLALIGEGLLPGTVTSHVGFSKILIAVGITILAVFYIGNEAGIKLAENKINKKTAILLIFILIALLFVSLIKINLILNIFITFLAIATGYFIYKLLLGEN